MRRRRMFVGSFLLVFGLFAFVSVIGNPRVDTLHGSDVVRLVASGLCLGLGLALLLRRFMFRGE